MSGIERDFAGFLGQPSAGDVIGGFSGEAGAQAALEAARIQAGLGREALGVTSEAQQRLEETLAPFVSAGLDVQGEASRLFGPEAAQIISQDPAFRAALNRQQQSILAQQAARGRVGAGETPAFLQQSGAQLGADFLSRQRGGLLGALRLGQASAAQQGAGSLATGRRSSDLLTQIGNAQAAGGIGAAAARQQGANNLIGLGATIASFFSDRRLKRNISHHGKWRGFNTYKYQYKNSDEWFIGVMSDEVKAVKPEAISQIGGFDVVDYEAL